MRVHLVDGTFELFRAHYGPIKAKTSTGRDVGATRGLLRSLLSLLRTEGATHVAVAFDHVIESFRNDLYPGYKTGEGIDPALYGQFQLAEDATRALGITVWSMVEFEADDALATGAARFAANPAVEQVLICSPDKDLTQCVRGDRIVCLDRMRKKTLNEDAVVAKFGVSPDSIPDFLALVGDTSDGYPGIPRWGEKSAAALLAAYKTIEAIPADERTWIVPVRGAKELAENLRSMNREAALFKRLATLRSDVPLVETVSDLEWRGPDATRIAEIADTLEDKDLVARATAPR